MWGHPEPPSQASAACCPLCRAMAMPSPVSDGITAAWSPKRNRLPGEAW